MTTITITTYDPEGRLNMSAEEAKEYYAFVASEAAAQGFDVTYTSGDTVDEQSRDFDSKCWVKFCN